MEPPARGAELQEIGVRQPDRNLLVYYFLQSLLLGPAFLVLLVPRYFKFRTLRYHLDASGIAAEWGALFRHEISLSYARIQDIHLASNLVERWLGIARIQIQTASGSSGAELTIEGLRDYEAVRDWIYSRMRGARPQVAAGHPVEAPVRREAADSAGARVDADPVVTALREASEELRRAREVLERLARDDRAGTP